MPFFQFFSLENYPCEKRIYIFKNGICLNIFSEDLNSIQVYIYQ